MYGSWMRFSWFEVKAARDELVEEDAEGMFATCIQHEMDHLEGILFIDHLSRLRRDRALAKVKKIKRAA